MSDLYYKKYLKYKKKYLSLKKNNSEGGGQMNWVSTGAYELYLPDPQKINQQIPQTKGQYGLIQWAVNVDRRVEDGQSKKKKCFKLYVRWKNGNYDFNQYEPWNGPFQVIAMGKGEYTHKFENKMIDQKERDDPEFNKKKYKWEKPDFPDDYTSLIGFYDLHKLFNSPEFLDRARGNDYDDYPPRKYEPITIYYFNENKVIYGTSRPDVERTKNWNNFRLLEIFKSPKELDEEIKKINIPNSKFGCKD
tara:strand:+ start:1163 stop:1906 length:744 start_codon:yes stop_codon:yes gene_type:complete